MKAAHATPPWLRCSLLALVCAASVVRSEPIEDNPVTPLGDSAPLVRSHPAYGSLIRGKVVEPVVLTEQHSPTTRQLDTAMSDLARLEMHFGEPMELNYNVLKESYPTAAFEPLPWSGDYWPTYRDGINAVWKTGEASPAEKYALAFGFDVTSFQSGISLSTGVLSEGYADSTTCSSDADCTALGDGSLCGLREGEATGYCIPTWFGICHAWAAAAILEEEPQCDVVANNVTFHSVDMKALISELYDGAAIEVVFTGARFDGPDEPEEVDEYGRYVDATRQDVGPGFFHIAIANILGKQQQSFIVDVSSDSQVWNQPVQKYEFLEMELVDAAATSLEYFGTDVYPFNDAMVYLAKCTTRLTWTAESTEDGALTTTGRIEAYTVYEDYSYCLELDANYTIIGGEWLDDSMKNHPDFVWFPVGKPSDDAVTDTGISYADLKGLWEQSMQCDQVTISPDAPDTSTT
ncbi:hypothetical protein BBJ28_00017990, partial [Nothophytophthora sp. Chile5]